MTEILKKPVEFSIDTFNTDDVKENENNEPKKEEAHEGLSREDFKRKMKEAAAGEDALVEYIEKNGLDAAFNELDANRDGTIQANEVSEALGNGTSNPNFSITELIKALINKISSPTPQEPETKPENQTENVVPPATENVVPMGNVAPTGGGGGSGRVGGGGGSGGGSTATDNGASSPKTVDQYSKEIQQKKDDKDKVKQNTRAGIQEQEQEITKAMTKEGSGIPPEAQAEYEQQKAILETQISEQTAEIEIQEGIIQDSNAKIESCDTAIKQVEGQISNLNGQLSSTPAEDSETKGRIKQKIKNLEKEIETLEGEKKAAEDAKATAEGAKQTAESAKTQLETEKNGLLDAILVKYKDSIPSEVTETIQAARDKIAKLKAQEVEQLSKLDSEIQTLKKEMVQMEQKEKVDKTVKENSEGPKMPETPKEWAMYGCKSPTMIKNFQDMHPKMQEDVIDLMDYMREQGYTVQVDKAKIGNNSGLGTHGKGTAIDIHFIDSNGRRNLRGYNLAGEYWMSKGENYRWLGSKESQAAGIKYEEWHFDIPVAFYDAYTA